MKNYLAIIGLLVTLTSLSQTTKTIGGETYNLNSLVKGELSFYTAEKNDDELYFISYNDQFEEINNNNYQEKFLQLIGNKYEDKIKSLNFNMRSLTIFIKNFNKKFNKTKTGYSIRLGVFGGVSNEFLFDKPNGLNDDFNDETFTVIGAELEFFSTHSFKRHSLFVQLRQTLDNSDVNFSLTQFSLNHRFKFINASKFNVFLETEFISFDNVKFDNVYIENAEVITKEQTSSSLDTPISFGVGMAYQITPKTQIAINYNDFYSLASKDNGTTPVDYTLSLKFTL